MATVKCDNFQAAAGSGGSTFGTSGSPAMHTVYGAWKGPNRATAISSANYTVTNTDGYDMVLVTTGASQRTITLPAVGSNTGRLLTIKKVDSGAGSVLIDTPSTETIDGSAQLTIYGQYGKTTLLCDGTNWHIVELTDSGTYLPTHANISNTTLVATYQTQWYRVQGLVTVFGNMDYNTGGATHSFTLTLPITPTAFTQTYQAGGGCQKLLGSGLKIIATTSGTTVTFTSTTDVGNGELSFMFSYRL